MKSKTATVRGGYYDGQQVEMPADAQAVYLTIPQGAWVALGQTGTPGAVRHLVVAVDGALHALHPITGAEALAKVKANREQKRDANQ